MTARVLLDTGPLVAFLNRRDRYHGWAEAQLADVSAPLYTCCPASRADRYGRLGSMTRSLSK